ncbi:hypothetical protein [Asticcacaulis sp. YBE204]|uniref:hypothetical protein n=1 Tax=Asticcacaulis sp. YBE204 TaxID=1282363 RepID=UPI0003C3DA77|nr:hypothetical protein [Asticcacaulis sp. YBE204]ESQ79899.1 hypothetical protein AEYBE204_08615 [Asticcacaulis sp. YBE204]
MKRVLTKKPQFEKTVLTERPKRNLKFSHTAVETPATPEPVTIAPVTVGVAELETPAYEWTTAETVVTPVRTVNKPAKSVGTHILTILLPAIGFLVLGLTIAALAKSSDYDWAFIASRF